MTHLPDIEQWEVVVGKDKYYLNEKQIEVLKQADLAGKRSLIWFDGFAISIPFISSIKRIYREKRLQYIDPGDPEKILNVDELRERISKMKGES